MIVPIVYGLPTYERRGWKGQYSQAGERIRHCATTAPRRREPDECLTEVHGDRYLPIAFAYMYASL